MTKIAEALVIAVLFTASSAAPLRAITCNGTAEITAERIAFAHNVLSGTVELSDFHLYADVTSGDGRIRFLLYSISNSGDAATRETFYLAAVTVAPGKKALVIFRP